MAQLDLLIDPVTGDLIINQVRLTKSGTESLAQKVKIRLLFFYKEWILNTEAGTKWFERILRKGATRYNADQEIRKRILDTEGIRGIDKFSSEFDRAQRTYSCTFTAITDSDEVITLTVPIGG